MPAVLVGVSGGGYRPSAAWSDIPFGEKVCSESLVWCDAAFLYSSSIAAWLKAPSQSRIWGIWLGTNCSKIAALALSVFFSKISCAPRDRSLQEDSGLRVAFLWKKKAFIGCIENNPLHRMYLLSRGGKWEICCFPLMQKKKLGRDRSVPKLPSLMQVKFALTYSLTSDDWHQAAFTIL